MNTPRILIMVAIAALMLSGCYTVPITGRSSFVAVSQSEETQLGLQAFTEMKQQTPLSKDAVTTARITAIGKRLARISEFPDWTWEFALFDDPKTPNAWCLPGGKVGVYSGLLPYTKTDAEMATVIAHEIAHAVARHGAERMTEDSLINAGAAVAVGTVSAQNAEMAKVAYGVGSQLIVALPHSRKQELEADHIGLIYMARAGYDPREAVTFWQRFSTAFTGQKPPAFLSTHPADAQRIAQIKSLLPAAIVEYNKTGSGVK